MKHNLHGWLGQSAEKQNKAIKANPCVAGGENCWGLSTHYTVFFFFCIDTHPTIKSILLYSIIGVGCFGCCSRAIPPLTPRMRSNWAPRGRKQSFSTAKTPRSSRGRLFTLACDRQRVSIIPSLHLNEIYRTYSGNPDITYLDMTIFSSLQCYYFLPSLTAPIWIALSIMLLSELRVKIFVTRESLHRNITVYTPTYYAHLNASCNFCSTTFSFQQRITS
jgi:hypothetical protein